MDWIKHYRLEPAGDGSYNLIIYFDQVDTEFAEEFGAYVESKAEEVKESIDSFIKKTLPNVKINAAKIMLGAMLLTAIPIGGAATAHAATPQTTSTTLQTYEVNAGDTLWKIASRFGVSVDQIKNLNHLTTNTIYVNQTLKVPTANRYTVQSGDTLYRIASKFNTTVSNIKNLNNLTSDTIYVGQQLKMTGTSTPTTVSGNQYTVRAGDSLWGIANKYNTSVSQIKSLNSLASDTIYVGQTLNVPTTTQKASPQETVRTEPYVTYTTHTVDSGDNVWSIALDYGIPMQEVLTANNLTTSSALTIGQTLRIPVHHIPVKQTVSERHGELLDWWSEAQYVFAINDVATVTDFETGKTFKIQRTIGANHADSEPLTATDTAIAKSLWGGYSWETRPVLIQVDGRKIAASMSFMPHSVQYITDNNFEGHLDVHFLNSTRHKDGQQDPYHQEDIKIAAGILQS